MLMNCKIMLFHLIGMPVFIVGMEEQSDGQTP